MASIRKRSGKYQARVLIEGRKYIAKTFLCREDAIRWARKVEVAVERGDVDPQSSNVPLRDLIKRYLSTVTPAKKNCRSESYLLKVWMGQEFTSKSAYKVDQKDLVSWREQRLAAGISTGTVRNALAALSAVYRHAAQDWGMDRLENPVMRMKRPLPCRARSRRVSEVELEAIKGAASIPELPVIIGLAIETGMRLSELVNLVWNNIDLRARTVYLPDTKNGESRTVPLSSRAVQLLENEKRGPIQRLDGRVFGCKPEAITVQFRKSVQRARAKHIESMAAVSSVRKDQFLIDLRFHDLRHEAVSRLFERGLNMLEVSAISGHKSLQMLKRYTHLKAEDLVKKLG